MICISLVTITYQAADVIEPTLESVMRQTYANVEHIIIDGASTDGTLDKVQTYKQQSDEADNGHDVSIISEPDKGIYDAMNKGLARASGEYVCFLNAGDRLPDDDTLERVAAVAMAAGDGDMPGVVYGDTDIVDANGQFLYHRRLRPPKTLTWRSFRQGMLVCHQAFYARTDVAKGVTYDTRYRYSADVDWCIRVMKEVQRRELDLTPVDAVVAHYLEEGQTTKHHKESLKERFRVMCHHYGWFSTVLMHAWFFIRKFINP